MWLLFIFIMSRLTNEKKVTSEEILCKTNNGLDIFRSEIPGLNLRKKHSSPFRKDSDPSALVKLSKTSGIYIHVDYGDNAKVRDPITFIRDLYNLTYQEALDKIAFNLNIGERIAKEITPIQKEITPLIYEFEEMRFKPNHHLYWNAGELSEDFLRKHNIFAASKIAVNKNVFKIPNNELCFIYVPIDLPFGNLKILRIGQSVLPNQKWRSNIPSSYLWSMYEHTEKVDDLWVIKSRKDEMIAKLLGLNTISTQSENSQVLNENMDLIKSKANRIILNMGSDPDGVKKSKEVQQTHKCLYYNTPKPFLPEVNDLFSFVSNFSLRQLERHIKAKKLL